MEEKEKNVKRNKQEDPVVVRSDRSRSYLQRSQSEQIYIYIFFSVINMTKPIKIGSGYE